MSLLYVLCAAVGGTVLVCQFLMSLLGWHGHGDFPDDAGGDLGHDFGHDGDAGGDSHGAEHDTHASTSIFRILSVRTVVAALAFFGLAGLAAESARLSGPSAFVLALAAGGAAMYSVHWLMQQLYKLREDGTVRVHEAIGLQGTVYVRIPAAEQGAGKVLLNVRDRTVELEAVTTGAEIATGAAVIVQSLAGPEVVRVATLPVSNEVTHV
jgi:hypothetical protein